MEPRTYLRAVDAAVRAAVPAKLGPIRHQHRGWQAKWWFGNPALHYEATPQVRSKAVEIGLHFESDELTNARLLAAFRAHARPVAKKLGDVRIEEWDRGWSRIWEPVPLTEPLGTRNGTALGKRLAMYIAVLEPILREELPADVSWGVTLPRHRGPARR